MEISTRDLIREAAAVEAFDGRSHTGLSRAELDQFLLSTLAVVNQAKVLAAVAAAEVKRRNDANRAAAGGSRRAGHASSRRRVAEAAGGSESEAERLIKVGTVLAGSDGDDEGTRKEKPPAWPLVAKAVLDGRLSTDKAEVIVQALEALVDHALPGLERVLVSKGEELSLRDLRRVVDATVRAANRRQLAEQQKAQHAQRSLRVWEGRDGLTHIRGELDPATAAPVVAFLEDYVRQQYAARRGEDPAEQDARTTAQMNADALATLARHLLGCDAAPSRSTALVVVRADRKELESELGLGECDQLRTPLSGEVLRGLACGAGIMPMLCDGRSLPLDYGRTKEFFTLAQRMAMLERDGGCALCHAPPSWCEAHHVVERSRGGPTNLGNGAMLCVRCHHDVHREGWVIDLRRVKGADGRPEDQIWFVPPASVDPQRRPRLGGRAALRIDQVSPDPLPGSEVAA